jgi:hypothetical protein
MAGSYEERLTTGKLFRSRRSTADTVYAYEAMRILMDAASEIEGLELLFDEKTHYMCRSILSQLGRMYQTQNYNEESIVYVAKVAIRDRKNGYSVKEIERYIQHSRLTGKW